MADRVDAAAFQERVLDAAGLVVVEFYSDSCAACKRLAPQLAKLEAAHEGALDVVKVNTTFEEELAQRFDILSAPTLLLFRAGEEVARSVGFKRLEELEEWVGAFL